MNPKPLSRTSRLIVPLGIRVSSGRTAPRLGLSIFIPPHVVESGCLFRKRLLPHPSTDMKRSACVQFLAQGATHMILSRGTAVVAFGILFSAHAVTARAQSTSSQTTASKPKAGPVERRQRATTSEARGTIVARAHADIAGQGITGAADFTERKTGTATGIEIHLTAKGLKPGLHGVHLHAVGKCEPDFAAAGGHLDPGPAGNMEPGANHPADL